MGSVYAKSVSIAESDEDDANSPLARLRGIKAHVDRVHVRGLRRTCDDMVRSRVDDLLAATSMEQVFRQTAECRHQLLQIGCFGRVGATIDTSDKSPRGLEVTFEVEELRRITGGVKTEVGQNDGALQVCSRLPNLFGRGESCQMVYSNSVKSSSSFNATVVKPYFNNRDTSLSASVYQSGNQFPSSSFHQLNRGALLNFVTNPATNLQYLLEYEAQWRHLTPSGSTTPLSVRRHAGHSLMSAIRHGVTFDSRNSHIQPSSGTLLKLQQEFAGLGGNVHFLKHQAELQLSCKLRRTFILQAGLRCGHLMPATWSENLASPSLAPHLYSPSPPSSGSHITDRFFMGGPLEFRGFRQRCAGGQQQSGVFLGGDRFWTAALHAYTPLPFQPGRGGFGDLFNTHLFVNVGNLESASYDEGVTIVDAMRQSWRTARLAYGLGLCIQLANMARVEVNYCIPVWSQPGDECVRGLQLGIGVAFL